MVERNSVMNERKTVMDEWTADTLAKTLGGQSYLTDENIWFVVIKMERDNVVVVITDVSVDEYADWEAFKAGQCYASVRIS